MQHTAVRNLPTALALLAGLLVSACAGGDEPADGCSVPTDCPYGQLCTDGACQEVRNTCDLNAQCPADQACVNGACAAQACGGPGECGAGRTCEGGRCVAPAATGCQSDADCLGGNCDPLTGRCILDTGDGCGDAGVCPAGSSCQAGQCVPDGGGASCDDDSGCADEQYCADGACAAGCRTAPDNCGDGQTCDAEARTCGEGEDPCARPCPAGSECDPENGQCWAIECADDETCPNGSWCDSGACAVGCKTRPGDCGLDQVCDEATRTCRCATSLGCEADQYCDTGSGQCLEGCRVAGSAPGVQDLCPGESSCNAMTRRCACAADAQCPDAQYCDAAAGECRNGCRLQPDSCADGMCNAQTRQCEGGGMVDPGDGDGEVGDRCVRAGDCVAGAICSYVRRDGAFVAECIREFGERDPMVGCHRNDDCKTLICADTERFCVAPCANNGDCPNGRCASVVQQGVMVSACVPNDRACLGTSDCDAGQVCMAIPALDDGVPRLRCRQPAPGGGINTPCQNGAQCQSGLCISDNTCWAPCNPDAAVSDCPMGERCYPEGLRITVSPEDETLLGTLPACNTDLGSGDGCPDGRCGAGEVCTLNANAETRRFDAICRLPDGAGGGGAPCATPDQCQSGVCISELYCLGVCDPVNPAGQCVAGSRCDPNVELTAGDIVETVSICVPL